MSQTQGSHRAVRRGTRGVRGGRTSSPPRLPEQRYDDYALGDRSRAERSLADRPRGLTVRPVIPSPPPSPPPYVPPSPPPYVPSPYAAAPPYAPRRVHTPNGPYAQPDPYERPTPFTPPAPPPRHRWNPYEHDTYRPSYEQAPAPAPAATPPPAPRPAGGRAAARRAAHARKAAQRPEALRRLVPQALVVAFLAGGTSAFVAHDKEVELTVDGKPRTLHTFADDVGELLAEEGVKPGAHDSVGRSAHQPLADGDEIAFDHGRPLDLTLDSVRRRVWTTERSVEAALKDMGVRTRGAELSLAPSADIPRSGIELEVRTERTVTFLADGHEKSVRTNAATVLEALAAAGIELDGMDAASAPLDSFPHDGQTVTVMRISGTEKIKEERIAFRTERHADPQLAQGTEVVARAGRTGLRRVTYRLRTVDGVREKPRRIAVEVLRHPRKQIIRVGTRPLPQSVPGADHLNWTALAQCESGGRPYAVDASGQHGGLYQFDTGTWQNLGGTGRPQDAAPQEQTYRAKKLYVSQGASPWPYCGRKLSP